VSAGHMLRSRLFRQHQRYQSTGCRQLAASHQLYGQSSVWYQHRTNNDPCRRR